MKRLDMPSLNKANEVLEKILKIAEANKLKYTFEASHELIIDFNSLIGSITLVDVKSEDGVEDSPKRGRGRPPKKTSVELPSDNKDLIMIKRVIRSRKISDPAEIAGFIMSNQAVRSQTTFTTMNDILGFIDKYKDLVFGK